MVITMVTSTTSVAPKLRASSLRIEEWNNIGCLQTEKQRIMDFELKTLDLAGAAAEKCDALIVLVHRKPSSPARTPCRNWWPRPSRPAICETKAGKLLQPTAAPASPRRACCWRARATARAKQVRHGRAGRCRRHASSGPTRRVSIVLCRRRRGAALPCAPRCWPRPTPATCTPPPNPSAEGREAQQRAAGRADAAAAAGRVRRRRVAAVDGHRVRQGVGQPAGQPRHADAAGAMPPKPWPSCPASSARCWAPRKSPSSAWARSWPWPRARRSRCASSCCSYEGARQGAGAGGAGGQGHHLRHRRHLDQAGGRDGRDEVRHGRRGQRAGRVPRAGRTASRRSTWWA